MADHTLTETRLERHNQLTPQLTQQGMDRFLTHGPNFGASQGRRVSFGVESIDRSGGAAAGKEASTQV